MIALGIVVITAAGVVLEPVLALFPDHYWEQLNDVIGTGVLAFLTTVVFVPLIEEAIFRAGILRLSVRLLGSEFWAIVVSALLFGFAHYPIWPQVPNAFVGGLILGYTYRISHTIWVPVAIHVLNNLLAWGTMQLFPENPMMDFRTLLGGGGVYWLLWTVCAAVFAWGMWKLHNIFNACALEVKI